MVCPELIARVPGVFDCGVNTLKQQRKAIEERKLASKGPGAGGGKDNIGIKKIYTGPSLRCPRRNLKLVRRLMHCAW